MAVRMVNSQILRGPVTRACGSQRRKDFPWQHHVQGQRSTESAKYVQGTRQSGQGGGSGWRLRKAGLAAGDYGAVKGDR